MMVPTKSLILAGAALALLGATAGAQTQRNKLFRRASAPRQATLDLSTGTYTRGPVINNRGLATVTDLSNVDIFDGSGFGWVTVDTGGGACTWFQMASKGNVAANQGVGGNPKQHAPPPGSDLITDVLFFYCSGALDDNSGGPGGAVELGFYEGYTIFGGAPTTVANLLNLTGMPANTAPGGFFGGARCYGLDVLFAPMFQWNDGLFVGYSWHFQDTGTDGTLASTFPFIACVVSCSGTSIIAGTAGGGPFSDNHTGLNEDGQGMLDAFDAFCTGAFPNGPTANTYTFATGGPFAPPFAPTTRASINIEIREKQALATTDVDYNDAAPIENLDTLTATPATLGTVWTASFARAGGGSGRFQIRIWRDRLGGNGVPPTIGSVPWPAGTGGRRMTSGAYLASVPPGQAPAGTPVAPTIAFAGGVGTATSGIPLDAVFCGLHFTCQARSGTGAAGGTAPRLSSAVEGTIGTF
jgi:hypothetical protein